MAERAYQWFRFYHRMYRSPEVAMLTDAEFRLLVSLWCMASAGAEENRQRGLIALPIARIRVLALPTHSLTEVEEMLQALEGPDCGLISRDEHGIWITDWNRHQYISPSKQREANTEYQRQYRQKQRDGLSVETSDTPSDKVLTVSNQRQSTETETEAETDLRTSHDEGFARWWSVVLQHPTIKRCGKSTAKTSWDRAAREKRLLPTDEMIATMQTQMTSHDWTKSDGQFAPMASTYLNQSRWEAELTPADKAPVRLNAWRPQSEINSAKTKKMVL